MNIRDLKYLVALADYKHFGKAAEACFVSQPALSMQIMKLEEHLGITLLERTNKSVLLTEHGMGIVDRARHILSQVEDIREMAELAKDPFSGEFKLGVFPTLAPYLLPLIIPPLSKTYPRVSFYLIEKQTAELVEQLKQGQLHAALLASPVQEKFLNEALLFEEEFLLATPATHPLAKSKIVKQQEMLDKKILLLDEGHCMRDQALALCHMLQLSENQHFRATSLETLRHMVSAGVGVTLMPKLACQANDTVSYIPFGAPKPMRAIGMYWRATSARQTLIKDMISKIKMILANQKAVKVL